MQNVFEKALWLLFIFLLSTNTGILSGQSPGNPTANITGVVKDFSTVITIEETFNAARRWEEMNLLFSANTIQDLQMPPQATWDSWTIDKQVLFLLNDERKARAGIDYGAGPALGRPLQGVEQHVDQVAGDFAQFLLDNDLFDHDVNGTPDQRVLNGVGANCEQPISSYENLYYAGSSDNDIAHVAEDAVFEHNYNDLDNKWGHRMADLTQEHLDDNGETGKEGFLGVGYATGTDYKPEADNNPFAVVLVFNFFDPVADDTSAMCNYNILVNDSEFDNIGGGNNCPTDTTVIVTMVMGNTLASNSISTSGDVSVQGGAVFSANTISLNSGFEVPINNCFEARNDGCSFMGMPECDITPDGTCAAPYVLVCGQVFNGSNADGQDSWQSYDNDMQSPYPAPEKIHTIAVPAMMRVELTLDRLSADLDMFVANTCSNNNTHTYSPKGGTTSETITPENNSSIPVLYYVIIDGFQGAVSSYTLTCTEMAIPLVGN